MTSGGEIFTLVVPEYLIQCLHAIISLLSKIRAIGLTDR